MKELPKKKAAASNLRQRKAFKDAAAYGTKEAVESVAVCVGPKTPKRRVTFDDVDSKETISSAATKRQMMSGIIEAKKRHRKEEKEEEDAMVTHSNNDDGDESEIESIDSSGNGSEDDMSDFADGEEVSEASDDEGVWENPFDKAKREGTRLSYEALRLSFLPPEFQEPQLFKFLSQFGAQVLNCFCVRSRRTHQSKGIAYVQFDNPAVIPVVVEECHGMSLGGRAVQARSVTLHRAMPSKEKTAHRRRLAYIYKTQGAPLSRHDLRRKNPVAALIKYSRVERANNKHLKRLGIDYEFHGFATQLANVPKEFFIRKERENRNKKGQSNGNSKSQAKKARNSVVESTVVSSLLQQASVNIKKKAKTTNDKCNDNTDKQVSVSAKIQQSKPQPRKLCASGKKK